MVDRVAVLSIGLCLVIASAITLGFLAVALSMRVYSFVDLAIGSVWFFTVSLLISMPLLIPRMRKMLRR